MQRIIFAHANLDMSPSLAADDPRACVSENAGASDKEAFLAAMVAAKWNLSILGTPSLTPEKTRDGRGG
jgi:hypothetical protein